MGQHVPFNDEELAFLNNFFCHFRWGDTPYEMAFPEGLYRANLHDVWDKTFLENATEFFTKHSPPDFLDKSLERLITERSDLILSQTPQQFFAVVEETIREVGLTAEEVARTINTYLHEREKIPIPDFEQSFVFHHRLDDFLAPIYLALRKKGYNRVDLIA